MSSLIMCARQPGVLMPSALGTTLHAHKTSTLNFFSGLPLWNLCRKLGGGLLFMLHSRWADVPV